MGVLKRMKSQWSIAKCGDVFASPVGELIIFLGRRKSNETPIFSASAGVRYIDNGLFNNSYAKVVKRADDDILRIDLGLEEIQVDQATFNGIPKRNVKRPWAKLEDYLSREEVHNRLSEELKKWESNRRSFRQVGTINSKY